MPLKKISLRGKSKKRIKEIVYSYGLSKNTYYRSLERKYFFIYEEECQEQKP